MAKGPREGDPAPDFELDGTHGRFSLPDHRGERVVLLFYPGDDTPTCTKQFCSYRDRSDEMDQLEATVVGISSQDLDSHERFIEHHGINVPLLADLGRHVAKAYGVNRPGLGTQRAVFVIDEEGVVRYRHVHTIGISYQSVDDLREALARIDAPATT